MSKWNAYKKTMWILTIFMTWVAAAIWMDGEFDFQLVFFSMFGICALSLLALMTLMDILGMSWGSKTR